MTDQNRPTVLITTLGAEAQIVPICIQLLARRGIEIDLVQVLHTNPAHSPIREALARLRDLCAAEMELPPLELISASCDDVLTPAQMEVYEQTVFLCLQENVRRGHRIHLLLAGGRKSASLVGLTVAQLLLGSEDRVWHLYSDEGLRKSGRHRLRPGDEAKLLPIPLPPPPLEPAFGPAVHANSPAQARQLLSSQIQEQQRRFLQEVLTPAEREVAFLAAREILTVQEMAQRLQKAPKTVTNQLNRVYHKLGTHLGRPIAAGVRRETLRQIIGRELGS